MIGSGDQIREFPTLSQPPLGADEMEPAIQSVARRVEATIRVGRSWRAGRGKQGAQQSHSIGNRLDIADAEKSIRSLRVSLSKAKRTTRTNEERISTLEEENEQLELLITMLLRRLQEKNLLDGDEILSLTEIIDPPEEKD